MPPSDAASSSLSSVYSFHNPALNDFAHSTVEDAVVRHFDGKRYDAAKAVRYADAVNKDVVESLSKACGNFKYICTSVVSENCGGGEAGERGMVVDASCCWSAESDDVVDVVWRSDEVTVVVQLFATRV